MDWQTEEKLLWEGEVDRSKRDYEAALRAGCLAAVAEDPQWNERMRLAHAVGCARTLVPATTQLITHVRETVAASRSLRHAISARRLLSRPEKAA